VKWINLPSEPLRFNPYQDSFWKAHRARVCKACKTEFNALGSDTCPTCKAKGLRKFHRLTLIAGRRGGKTRAASIAAVEEACIPNSIVWCCAPTNPKLHRYVIPAVQQLIPEDWVAKDGWSSEFLDLRLKNNSLIHFQTLEDPDQGRGQGLDCVWIDEVCELTEDHWLVLRPSLTERRGAAIFSSSPRSYDWVWESFYHKAELGAPGYWACRYRTSDNPIISADEIAEAKATMPPAMFSQEFEADFVIFTGAVYGGAVDAQLLRTDDQIKKIIPEWPAIDSWRQVLVGIDTGADHPFGAVKLVSTEQGLVVVGEYLERHRSFIEHAGSMKMLANNATAKWAINRNERQPMIELAQHGITCQPAENDVVAGTERVKSWLHMKQLWFVESLCPMTVKQMKAYRWAPDKTKDGQVRKEKVYKKDDELPDCLRYAVMTWPQLPKLAPAATERDISKLPDEMRGAITRLRKIDKESKLEPFDVTGDFWM
jgi:hypothetical protein